MQRGRNKSRPFEIASILEKTLKKRGFAKKIDQYKVVNSWDKIVGEQIASCSEPLAIQGNTLVVKVSSPAWMNELQFMKTDILEKIQASLNNKSIGNIRFRTGIIDKKSKKENNLIDELDLSLLDSKDLQFIESTISKLKDQETADIVKRIMKKDFAIHKKRSRE
ncbi:DUF721 domain-containing protein [bacterium]|nr:DUF721 domain-containing protein [bacterium]